MTSELAFHSSNYFNLMSLLRMPSWYVLYTYPNFEKKVYNDLQEDKINAFLPLQTVTRQWSDRKKKIEVPLFPNYIFVNITMQEKVRILKVKGAVRFITFDNKHAVVSDQEIDTIRKFSSLDREISADLHFEVGEVVKVCRGPFEGLEGILTRKKGKDRFGIKLDSINLFLSVEINLSDIEKIRASSRQLVS